MSLPRFASIPLLLALAVLGTYVATLCPTVAGGDSGELIAAATTGGVVHPPGYPLYLVLARVIAWVPVGTVAWRVNLLSALCGTAAVVLLHLTVRRITRSDIAGVAAAGLLAFSSLAWRFSIVAEVFALNSLFVCALLCFFAEFECTRSPRLAILGAFTLGLGLANHHSLIFTGAFVAAGAFAIGGPEFRKPSFVGKLLGAFAVGLMPYGYLSLRGQDLPIVLWGDFSSVQGFLTHILRSEYGTFKLAARDATGWSGFPTWVGRYFSQFASEASFLATPLAAAGLLWGLRHRRTFTIVTLAAFGFYVVVFHLLSNVPVDDELSKWVQSRFWLQPNLLAFFWVGFGFKAILEDRLGTKFAAVAALLLIAAQGALHFGSEDQSGNFAFRDYGRTLLESLPQDAVLMTRGDISFGSARHAQLIEGLRPDVKVLNIHLLGYPWIGPYLRKNFPELRWPGGGFQPESFLAANSGAFRFFAAEEWPALKEDPRLRARYPQWPIGLVSEIGATPPNIGEWVQRSRAEFRRVDIESLSRFPESTWESAIHDHYWSHWIDLADLVMEQAEVRQDRALHSLVAELLEEAAQRHRKPWAGLYKNLGTVYAKLIPSDPRAAAGARRNWERYLAQAPESEARTAQAVRAWLEQLPR